MHQLFNIVKMMMVIMSTWIVGWIIGSSSVSAHPVSVDANQPLQHSLPVSVACAGQPWQDLVWIHPHANETTSAQLGWQFLQQQHSGCLYFFQKDQPRRYVTVTAPNMRYQYDPNRIFTTTGRKQTLTCLSRHCDGALQQLAQNADFFTQQILSRAKLIVALHNNRPGGLSVRQYATGGRLAHDVAAISMSTEASDDDFFYVTTPRAFDFLAARNFNVVLQHNQQVQDDGSLSVWAAKQQIDYINVEAGINHPLAQQEMLQAIWAYMQSFYADALKAQS